MLGKDGRNYPDRKGVSSPSWCGGIQHSGNGALYQVAHNHPRSDKRGRVYQHVLMVEKVLGKLLPLLVVIHHVDGDRSHNENSNFVVCENQGYHNFLHRRKRAYEACGKAHYLRCRHCREWDDPLNMTVLERKKEGVGAYHKACHTKAERERVRRIT